MGGGRGVRVVRGLSARGMFFLRPISTSLSLFVVYIFHFTG